MLFASTAQVPAVAAPSTAGASAPAPVQTPLPPRERTARRPTPGRLYAGLAALAVGLAALSLLAPSTPSYDPWSWTLWAREIVHGHLVITTTGTSWKPLPMIFTIPFALFGPRVAPELWLVVGRAGAMGAGLLGFRPASRRVAALVALGFAARGAFIPDNGLGYSDALAAALALVAIDCVLDRRHRAAFLVGFLVALDRPEIWLFWVPYGLWLARRDRSMRALVAICFTLQPIAWFLPVYLGSGHFGSSITRATHPRANSLAYASDPFWDEFAKAALPTVMLRIKLMGAVLVAAAAAARWPAGRARKGA